MRLSVNLIVNQTFFPLESEVPDDRGSKDRCSQISIGTGARGDASG